MHTLSPLPYKTSALEPFIDALTMEIHHDKHHQAYVNNLNNLLQPYSQLQSMSVEELLTSIEAVPAEVKQGVINNAGGHANHSFFWNLITPGGAKTPSDELMEIFDNDFGSFEDFKTKFTEVATKRFGSGWAWLVRNLDGKFEVYSTANQDSPLMEGKTPIIGLDVWEHAYYLKYQNRRPEYIEAFWNIVNWDKVEENLA